MKVVDIMAVFTKEANHARDTHPSVVSNPYIQYTTQHKAKLPQAARNYLIMRLQQDYGRRAG